jgi:uncharacterized protein YegL
MDIIEEQFKTIYSTINTSVKELSLDNIKKLVERRCVENQVQVLDKIYGFEDGCPICMNDYTMDSWIVLHPCGHLLCDICLSKINNLVHGTHQTRICPICRVQSKWIGSTNHNLNTLSALQVQGQGLAPTPAQALINNNIQSRFVAQPMHANYGNSEHYPTSGILIPSKPPIIEVPELISEPKIQSQLSKQTFEIDGQLKVVGNISIIADEIHSTNGIDLLIVFDVSGSMSSVSQEGISILKYMVDCLDSKDRLSIITFDSRATQLFALQPMISNIKTTCKTHIDNCFTSGSTNMESAIDLMIKVKEEGIIETRPFKIIVLSDGNPDTGKEGFHLIKRLYEGEIKPEIYSCTFGNNVRADVMKNFLTEQNLLNYSHIENMDIFKTLIADIGLDKNIVIGKNIKINLTNMEVLSNLAKQSIDDPFTWEVDIEQIKTSDVFTIPVVFNSEMDYSIKVSYYNNANELIELENQNIDDLDNFVKNNFWYKKIGEQIKNIMGIRETTNNKLEILNKIIVNVTLDNLGDFFQEINNLITETRLMLSDEHNNTYYNTCTASALRSFSYASRSANVVYKSKSANNHK